MVQRVQAQSRTRSSGTGSPVTALVEKAKDGDRIAFGHLVDLFQEPVFRMVYFRTRSSMDAEDLTQEIFIKAFANLPRLRDSDKFRAWLFRMTINRVRDHHRKERILGIFKERRDNTELDLAPVEEEHGTEALDHVMKKEFWGHIKRFASQLSRWEKEVFFLRFMDHLSIREIAQVLNKSESAVKTHLYRGLKKFRGETALLQLLKG
jgi:RNA polymerase sigma-70 factor (ECF subfamily)